MLEVSGEPDTRLPPEEFLQIAYEKVMQLKSILT